MEEKVEGRIFKLKEYWMLFGAVHMLCGGFKEAVTAFEECIRLKEGSLKESTLEN